MIKAEKINHRKAILRVSGNINTLKAKEQSLDSIYEIIFSRPNFTYLEILNSFSYLSVTYGDADSMNKKYANYFSSIIDNGTKYVGILLDNSQEWIYSFFGLILAGFVPVLLSTSNLLNDSIYAINKLGIKYVITNKFLDNVEIINPFEVDFSGIKGEFKGKSSNEIVFLTSGTTGFPKIVFYTGKEVCEQIYNAWGILKKDKSISNVYKGYFKHLVILPFYHMFGLFAVLLWFSFFNVTFVLPKDLSPLSIRQACLLTKPSHIFAVPLFWETIEREITYYVKENKIENQFNKGIKLSESLQKRFGNFGTNIVRNIIFRKYLDEILGNSIRFCISGGAFISNNTLKLINCLGYKLCNGYGSTEIGITSFSDATTFKERSTNSIGKPFDNIEYKIENNELFVKGPSIAKHILDGEKEIFIDNDFVNTQDYVFVDKEMYFISGRKDEMIIGDNGENISLNSLENEIETNSAKEFALISVNKKIILVLVFPTNSNIELIRDEVNKIKTLNVSKFINEYYISFDSLPKANGLKIKRKELARLIENEECFMNIDKLSNNSANSLDDHETNLLKKVINIFQIVFPDIEVKADSNFYANLGGDSFKYYLLINEIEKTFLIKLNIEESVKMPQTPLEFVKYIKNFHYEMDN